MVQNKYVHHVLNIVQDQIVQLIMVQVHVQHVIQHMFGMVLFVNHVIKVHFQIV